MRKLNWLLTFATFASFLSVTGCGAPGSSAHSVATTVLSNVGCKAARSEMWNSFYRIAEEGAQFPSADQLHASLLSEGQKMGLPSDALAVYADAFTSAYQTTIAGIQSGLNPRDEATWKKALAEMEIGVSVTPVHAALHAAIETSLAKVSAAESPLGVNCGQGTTAPAPVTIPGPTPAPSPVPVASPSPAPAPAGTVWDQLKATTTPEVYGLRRAFAVAYQSCDALNLTPMTTATPAVQGIKDLGANSRPDGGHVREIGSLATIVATDYYIHNQRLAANSCFEVRNDPLIYNYGGKPTTSSAKPYLLDLFTHNSGGGPTLGIDCSGYVFSALALAGLKLDPDPAKVMKADLVWGVGSVAFKEPQSNGLRCLQKISVSATSSLMAGDIVAINGHVFMIDSVGADPFGLAPIQKLSDCTTAKVSSARFDFVIAQSAAFKSGIGINRVRGADYMPESSTIRNGLIQYALAACRAKFGAAPAINSPDLSIVRHTKTAACTAPAAMTMTHEDCIATCAAN